RWPALSRARAPRASWPLRRPSRMRSRWWASRRSMRGAPAIAALAISEASVPTSRSRVSFFMTGLRQEGGCARRSHASPWKGAARMPWAAVPRPPIPATGYGLRLAWVGGLLSRPVHLGHSGLSGREQPARGPRKVRCDPRPLPHHSHPERPVTPKPHLLLLVLLLAASTVHAADDP